MSTLLLLPPARRPTPNSTRAMVRRLTPRSRYPTVDPHRLRVDAGPLPKLAWIFGLRR